MSCLKPAIKRNNNVKYLNASRNVGIQEHLYTTLKHRDKNRKYGITIFKCMHTLLIPGIDLKAIPIPNPQSV